MKPIAVVSIALLSACASGGGTTPGSTSGNTPRSTTGATATAGTTTAATPGTTRTDVTTVHIGGVGGGDLRVREDDGVTEKLIAFPVDAVWRALPAVFDSLGIVPTRAEPAAKLLGTDGSRLRRRLGTVALSRYFDCGTTQVGANADSYDVMLVLLAHLTPNTNNFTTVEMTIIARARPVAYAQPYARCGGRGALDERFMQLLKAELLRR